MSFNLYESIFVSDAISKLEEQLIALGEWPESEKGKLYLGGPYTFMSTQDRKLTIAEFGKEGAKPRSDITPVDCYNFYKPMALAEAVAEYLDRQRNPEKYENSFFTR